MKTTILTWLWSQPNGRSSVTGELHYSAEHVNIWADMVRCNLTADAEIAVCTDMTDGIDPSIRIIPMPPMPDIDNPFWKESEGAPQCYRRLHIYRPDAADVFGTERILMMDLDVVIGGNIDRLVNTQDDLRFLYPTSRKRPLNGGLQFVRCGAKPVIWTRFNAAEAQRASQRFVGSDQAWLANLLGKKVNLFTREQGVLHYNKKMTSVADSVAILFFPGFVKPWHYDHHGLQWVRQHYRRTEGHSA